MNPTGYYQLDISYIENSNFAVLDCDISINGVFMGSTQIFIGEKYIGIYAKNARISAKSLFISGTPTFIDKNHTINMERCAMTVEPSSIPVL